MTHTLETMSQPEGSDVRIEVWGESCSCYTDEEFKKNPGLKGTMHVKVRVYWPWGSYHSPREYHDKVLYFDHRGLYTYKKQKEPFYFWKPQNIEEDYENWTKDSRGYRVPLNEPRKLKRNIF